MKEEIYKFTRAEARQLLSYAEARERPVTFEQGYWYYGNRENFEKRHERIKDKLTQKEEK